MALADVLSYYRDMLLKWHEENYPERELLDTYDETIGYIANLYGRDRLLDMYREEMDRYIDAVDPDERRPAPVALEEEMNPDEMLNYLQALYDDLETEDGQMFGA